MPAKVEVNESHSKSTTLPNLKEGDAFTLAAECSYYVVLSKDYEVDPFSNSSILTRVRAVRLSHGQTPKPATWSKGNMNVITYPVDITIKVSE
jgi:hypothetical protein